jgi:hypothetical protein
MQQGIAIMSCTANKIWARQNQNGRMLTSWYRLYITAHPHTAARTRAKLEYLNWELFDQPPHRPDITPRDYHFLPYLKNWLRLQPFNNKELMEGVEMWLSSYAAQFIGTDKQKLIPRYRYFNIGGN